MAITKISEPAQISLIGNPIVYKFSMTGTSSPTEIRRIGYQLLNDADVPITALEAFAPKDNESFEFDFRRSIRKHLSTAVPQLSGDRMEASMHGKFKLKYWEIVTDRTTCMSTVESVTVCELFTVLNSATQYYGNYNSSVAILLTHYPESLIMCRNASQLFYLYPLQAFNVIITAYIRDSITNQLIALANTIKPMTPNVAQSFSVSAIDLANEHSLNPSDIHLIRVQIDEFDMKIVIGGCCSQARIAYQHAEGGYGYMDFDSLETRGVSINFSEIYRYRPFDVADSELVRTEAGLSINEKIAKKQFTFIKQISKDSAAQIAYYENFLSSSSYFLVFKNLNGVEQLMKFIVTSGTYGSYDRDGFYELRVTGIVNQYHQKPV